MYGRPVISQEWSVHAQLTISHSRPNESSGAHPTAATFTSSEHQNPEGVHVVYSWDGQPNTSTSQQSQPQQSDFTTNIPSRPCYGFQRGNILFTTRPPPREFQAQPSYQQSSAAGQPQRTTNLLDSGYSSEQISPGSYASLPTRRTPQPYSRRCKSTCSIVLSNTENQNTSRVTVKPDIEMGCLRETEDTSAFKCGDPVCYHQQSAVLPAHQCARPRSSDFSPVPETCEVCGGGRSPSAIRRTKGLNTFTTHFCTRVAERSPKEEQDLDTSVTARSIKDAASQTSEHLLATAEKVASNKGKSPHPKISNKVYGGLRRKTNPELQLPEIITPEPTAEATKPSLTKRLARTPAHRLSRSPARVGEHSLSGRRTRASQFTSPHVGGADAMKHKPRTVHIDVYCTGSEDADASGSSDESEEISDSWSSPQTVFESEKVKVVHSKAGKDQLPAEFIREQTKHHHGENTTSISRRSESFKDQTRQSSEQLQLQAMRRYDSDDGLSSHYPSQITSSHSLETYSEPSMSQSEITSKTSQALSSTVPSSRSTISDECSSVTATSWKDTTTDLESLFQSSMSLANSDSFEYADSVDRLRIREKERAWAGTEEKGDGSKSWKSPQLERKHFLQQQKLKEFLEKHFKKSVPVGKLETTEDSDDDDETGDAWSFCGRDSDCSPRNSGTMLKREDTVKRVTPAKDKVIVSRSSSKGSVKKISLHPNHETGSLSDSAQHRFVPRATIGPFGTKSPSPPPSKVPTVITSPFTTRSGKRTAHLTKAEKFGTIVCAFRKPGHHVGPSKNPECGCEHCRKYYETIRCHTRTSSAGDIPIDDNWKAVLDVLHKDSNVPSVTEACSMNVAMGLGSDLEGSITEDVSTDTEGVSRQNVSSVCESEDDFD